MGNNIISLSGLGLVCFIFYLFEVVKFRYKLVQNCYKCNKNIGGFKLITILNFNYFNLEKVQV